METKTGYIVWSNSDLTEGRGCPIPIYYCVSKTTAERLAVGKGVMGSLAQVNPFDFVKINGHWCGPVIVQAATVDDIATDKLKNERAIAVEKAKAAGLTEKDIALLVGAKL